MEEGRLLTAKQVAAWLGMASEITIYRWARDGFIPVVRAGGATRFDRLAIEAWMATGGIPKPKGGE